MAPPDLETDVPPPPPSTSSSPSTRPLADPFPGLPPRRASNYQSDIQQLPKEFRNLIAGGLAGMVAKSVVAPADRIKILFQVSSAEFHITRVPKVAWNIIETEGIQALWKGNTATMIRVFPYSGIQFMVFDRCKTYLLQEQLDDYRRKRADDPKTPKPKWGLSPVQSLQAGMIAGATSVLCTYPLDLTRAQLAVLRRHKHAANKGFFGVLKENYMNRGVPGLFRGIGPTMLGILPYSGIAFAFNEQGKRKVSYVFSVLVIIIFWFIVLCWSDDSLR
jgi:solute carrier family 25, member 42